MQEEDDTSLPQKIPPCFSFYCSTGWRGHTPRNVVYEALAMPTLSDVAVSHVLRFHEPPPPTSSPVLSEWSFCEAEAVEEGKRRRHSGPRSREARQRRFGRGEPNTIGHEEFTILHSNIRGFISRVAELSARLRLMESKPSVLFLTETWADKGLPSLRIESYTLISRRDHSPCLLWRNLLIGSPSLRIHRLRSAAG